VVALQVLRTTQLTITRTFTVDEVPTSASGNVVVTVARWDGTIVATGNATGPVTPGVYSYVLTGGITNAAATWQLDDLNVRWEATVGGSVVRLYEDVEVVGGFYFGIGQFRSEYKDFASTAKFTTASLSAKRSTVEREIEAITWRSFVPRYARDDTVGSGTRYLGLAHCEPRLIRAVTVNGVDWTADQIASLTWMSNGLLMVPEGAVWVAGAQIVVEYEHGLDQVPGPVEEAAMFRLRSRLGRPGSAVPDNAQSYTTAEGAIYRLGQGGPLKTGIPTVDSDLVKFARARRRVTA
jgi:hypothetical protein